MNTQLLIICLLAGSCAYHVREPVVAVITPVPTDTTTTDTVVSYKNHIKPIMITYCCGTGNQSCHVAVTNQGSPGDFSSYPGLKAKASSGAIASRVFNPLGGMPPSYSNSPRQLLPTDLQNLKTWVANGAPDN